MTGVEAGRARRSAENFGGAVADRLCLAGSIDARPVLCGLADFWGFDLGCARCVDGLASNNWARGTLFRHISGISRLMGCLLAALGAPAAAGGFAPHRGPRAPVYPCRIRASWTFQKSARTARCRPLAGKQALGHVANVQSLAMGSGVGGKRAKIVASGVRGDLAVCSCALILDFRAIGDFLALVGTELRRLGIWGRHVNGA